MKKVWRVLVFLMAAGGCWAQAGATQAFAESVREADRTADTKGWNTVALPADIAALPDVTGDGNVPNLRQAMAQDESGRLRALVEEFVDTSADTFVDTTDAQAKAALLDQILFAWTGADRYSADSRGAYLDGRKLYVLEAFLGRTFRQSSDSVPGPAAAAELLRGYNILADFVSGQILAQTHFKPLYELIEFSFDADSRQWIPDVDKLVTYFQEQVDLDEEGGLQLLNAFADNLRAVNEEYSPTILDTLNQSGELGGSAFEVALFSLSRNAITGDAANNALIGTDADDLLIGRSGDDVLWGGTGNDIYYFARGDGKDTVCDYDILPDNKDVIAFAKDIKPEDVIVTRSGNNLVLSLLGTTDQITVSNFFSDASYAVEEVRFADGTMWDMEDVLEIIADPVI